MHEPDSIGTGQAVAPDDVGPCVSVEIARGTRSARRRFLDNHEVLVAHYDCPCPRRTVHVWCHTESHGTVAGPIRGRRQHDEGRSRRGTPTTFWWRHYREAAAPAGGGQCLAAG